MQSRLYSLLEAHCPRYPHKAAIVDFTTKAVEAGARAVILFGSLAKGKYTQFSDADVMSVFPVLGDWKERFHQFYGYGQGIVEPVLYTEAEVKRMLAEGNPFLAEVIEDGLVLYATEGYDEWLRREVESMKKRFGFQRIPGGWRITAANPERPDSSLRF